MHRRDRLMGKWKDLKLPRAQPEAQPLPATTVPERVLLQGLWEKTLSLQKALVTLSVSYLARMTHETISVD